MNTFNRKVSNFPTENNLYHVDIIELYKQGKLDELNNFVVCRDQDDNVTATFGQERWNLMPFARNDAKNSLDFSNFIDTPRLKNELKILAYGVLFSKGNLARKPLAFSTVHGKLGCLKDIYHFLKINNLESIQSLSISANMLKLEHYLFNGDYKQTTISQKLTSLNAVLKLRTWHNLQVNFKPLNSRVSARKLGHGESQQLLVIPERLNNEIYGKAIELVENALPHANLIAEIERELQDNYMEGKRIVEEKLKKKRFAFSNANGDVINTHKFSMTVYDNQPRSGASIVQTLNGLIKDIKIESAFDFNRYWSQLITACYIICGGFSGMRYSELDKLTPESYYIDTFDGRDYHLLQSHTFKLGEKRETWITAPVTKKAISLASTLTKYMRSQVVSADKKYTNSLWVNQSHRSHKPKKILKWNERLTQFCSQFNFVVTEADYQECLESNPRSTERVKHTVKVGQPWAFSTHQFRRTLAFYLTDPQK